MEDLPEALVAEILKKITRTSDLNSLSLVSKQLYKMEGNQRGAISVGSGLCTATKALKSLCARFPNLWKVEIDYSGKWKSITLVELMMCEAVTDVGMRFIAHTPCLSNLTLRLCHEVTDVGVAELGHAHKLQNLVIDCCSKVSLQAAQGVTKLAHYSRNISDAFMTVGLKDC